jgi:hypothetical protein
MRKVLVFGLTALAVVLSSPGPMRADSAKVPVKGLLKSGGITGVTTTPGTVISNATEPSTATGSQKVFVLTQACFTVTGASGIVTVQAGAYSVASFFQSNNNAASCQSFTPGYVVPEGTDVTCVGNASATTWSCSVSGIVAKNM